MKTYKSENEFMAGFQEPAAMAQQQSAIWENYLHHEAEWQGMEHDPHDHSDALYAIPYVAAGLQLFQHYVPQTAQRILEIGCAQGYILNHVGSPEAERVGVDFNEDRVRKGRAQYPNTHFIVGDTRQLLALDGKFDVVMLPGIIEHIRLQEGRTLIDYALNLLTPGGSLLFDLPWWSGAPADFNSGIHMNPCHCWVGTQYRWDWLFRGLPVERIPLPEWPFYMFGRIVKPEPTDSTTDKILVGCWGKIGDILHALPMAQQVARTSGQMVYVTHAPDFNAVDPILDLLQDIAIYRGGDMAWTAADLGLSDWQRIINASHNGGRTDPLQDKTIFGWWSDGRHGIDFAAGHAGLTLAGSDRLLHFKPNVLPKRKNREVIFLSNTADAPMRGLPAEWWAPLVAKVQELGGKPVECASGPICNGEDLRHLDLGAVVKRMAAARVVISVDTLASALLAQSVGTPIIRLYRATHDSMTGAVLPEPPVRAHNDAGYGTPPDVNAAIRSLEELWTWKK